jgi:hypothetical protein
MARWNYLDNGSWGYQDPQNPQVAYANIDGGYYPAQDQTQQAPVVQDSYPVDSGMPQSPLPVAPDDVTGPASESNDAVSSINSTPAVVTDGTVEPAAAESTSAEAVKAEPAKQAEVLPSNKSQDGEALTYYSKDNTRLVEISGLEHKAELFDTSAGSEPKLIASLGSGVKDIQFFNQEINGPTDVMVFLDGGSFVRYDGQGRDLD